MGALERSRLGATFGRDGFLEKCQRFMQNEKNEYLCNVTTLLNGHGCVGKVSTRGNFWPRRIFGKVSTFYAKRKKRISLERDHFTQRTWVRWEERDEGKLLAETDFWKSVKVL